MSRYCLCVGALLISLTGCQAPGLDATKPIEQGLCTQNPNDPCCPGSPIILDLDGDGFALTNLDGGVHFRLNPSADIQRVSWTAPGSDDAWLVLDREHDGVDDGSELFGNFTPQAPSADPNGYRALMVFDKNRDSVIDSDDAVYEKLRLWQDRNHDGRAQPEELSTLAEHGIVGLDLRYSGTRTEDQYGNFFRYGAAVKRSPGSHVGPVSYDVYLITSAIDQAAREQGAMRSDTEVSMENFDPAPLCKTPGGGGGGHNITDPSIFYKSQTTVGGAICRAVCWAAGSAVCAAVGATCAIGSVVTIGGLTVPCTAALIAACAAGGGMSSICSDYVCPP